MKKTLKSLLLSCALVAGILAGGTGASISKANAAQISSSTTYKTTVTGTTTVDPCSTVSLTATLYQNKRTATGSGRTAITSGVTYQWYRSSDNGANWDPIDTAAGRKATYTFTASYSQNGYRYKCKATKLLNTATSSPVTLTVNPKITINSTPNGTILYTLDSYKHVINATGENLKYKWEHSADGTNWTGAYTTTTNYQTIMYNLSQAGTVRFYRCTVYNSYASVTSSAWCVFVLPVMNFTSNPVNKTCYENESVTFSAVLTTVANKLTQPVTYRWEYSTDGKKWSEVQETSATTSTLSITAKSKYAGAYFRCTAVSGKYSATSESAQLTTKPRVKITSNPVSTSVSEGKKAVFSVRATGLDLHYSWEYQRTTGATWNPWYQGSDSNELVINNASGSYDHYNFRCVVTSGTGNSTYRAYSTPATLEVPFFITVNITAPTAYYDYSQFPYIVPNQEVLLAAKSNVSNASYTWECRIDFRNKTPEPYFSNWHKIGTGSTIRTSTEYDKVRMYVRCTATSGLRKGYSNEYVIDVDRSAFSW